MPLPSRPLVHCAPPFCAYSIRSSLCSVLIVVVVLQDVLDILLVCTVCPPPLLKVTILCLLCARLLLLDVSLGHHVYGPLTICMCKMITGETFSWMLTAWTIYSAVQSWSAVCCITFWFETRPHSMSLSSSNWFLSAKEKMPTLRKKEAGKGQRWRFTTPADLHDWSVWQLPLFFITSIGWCRWSLWQPPPLYLRWSM